MINRVQQPWYHLPEKEVLDHFETSLDRGLEPANVTERKERFGSNILTVQKGKGPLALFAPQFHQPLVDILLTATLVTLLLEEWVDAGVIFIHVIMGGMATEIICQA